MAKMPKDRLRLRRRTDRGDTLIEVLIGIVIIALAVGPLLGALIESLASSTEEHGLAGIDTLLKSFAETAKAGIELSPPAGHGSLSGSTATSSVLFVPGTTYKGDGISGTGIPATTTITAENAGAHTATLSSPVTSEPTETLTIVLFNRCATTYPLLSRPSRLKGPATSVVTIFGTGFGAGVALANFSVTVGTQPVTKTATVWAKQSLSSSDSHGNMEVTFKVPSGLPLTSPEPIVLRGLSRGGGAMSVESLPGDGFTELSGTATKARSSDARYTLGIVGIRYWNLTTGTFGQACTAKTSSGIQMVRLSATPPTGGSAYLSFVLRNPSYFAPPIPTPAVLVTGKTVALPYTGGPAENLVFTAVITPPVTNPAPTGTVTWKLTAPTLTLHPACTTTSQTVPTGTKTLVATCKLTLSTASKVGLYTAVAKYPGDAYNKAATGSGSATVYEADGTGSMKVSPTAILTSSTITYTFTYTPATGGTGNGQVDLLVPTGWTLPQTATPAAARYVTATGGSGADGVVITGRTIKVSGVTLTSTKSQKLIITIAHEPGPAVRKRYTFVASEFSTSGGTLTTLRSGSPVVVVTVPDVVVSGKTATTGTTLSTTVSVVGGDAYLVYVFSSLSGTGDTASIASTGFSPSLTFTLIGAQQKFDATKDHEWVWRTKATSASSGKVTVTLKNTIKHAFLEVVQLVGTTTPAVVTGSKGFHPAGAKGTSANASLSTAPSNATDPEVIFLGAEGSLGTTAPALPGFLTAASGFASSTSGSFVVYTGLATRTEFVTIPSNWWGTIALEIHG